MERCASFKIAGRFAQAVTTATYGQSRL